MTTAFVLSGGADLRRRTHARDVSEEVAIMSDYYGAVFAAGALTAREKALVALAVAHAEQCPYCIDAYTAARQEKGAELEQKTEAVHVATAIRGGASLVHGMQMLAQVRKTSLWSGRRPAWRVT